MNDGFAMLVGEISWVVTRPGKGMPGAGREHPDGRSARRPEAGAIASNAQIWVQIWDDSRSKV